MLSSIAYMKIMYMAETFLHITVLILVNTVLLSQLSYVFNLHLIVILLCFYVISCIYGPSA